MELANEFVVHCPVDRAWTVLTDVERIAPCLPDAQLTEVEGDVYRGVVKVKVGPIVARFAGQARFVELDADNRRAVLDARGRESTGKGLASATVTAQLQDEGDDTRVRVTTDLTISGRLAQFGRGTLAEVSSRLLTQFAERLEQTVLSQQEPQPQDTAGADESVGPAPEPALRSGGTGQDPRPVEPTAEARADAAADAPVAAAADSPGRPGEVRVIDGPEAEPVDLLRSAGAPVLKRLVPLLVALAAAAVVLVLVFT